jgi:ribosome biogenesis protein BRX1
MTMEELKFEGNCLKGSRPIVSFEGTWEKEFAVMKEMLKQVGYLRVSAEKSISYTIYQIFAVPKTSRRTKPFVDHIIHFSILDNKIWFRHFQIIPSKSTSSKDTPPISLSEIGPRFVLQPIKIFEGSYSGATLYSNAEFVAPGKVERFRKMSKADKYLKRKERQSDKKDRDEIVQEQREDRREREGLDKLEKRKICA